MMKKEDLTAIQMADVITEKASEFSIHYEKIEKSMIYSFFKRLFCRNNNNYKKTIKERKFLVYPPTFGKMELLSKIILNLDIDENVWKDNPSIEIWRVCNEKTDLICRFIAIAVTESKKELMDDMFIKKLSMFIKCNGTPEDFVKIFLIILEKIDLVNFTNAMLLTKLYKLNEPNHKKAESIA